MDLLEFFVRNRVEVLQLTLDHTLLVAVAVVAACATGIPIGVLLTRIPSLSRPVLAAANILQTIPSLALFGLLIPLLGSYGIGRVPALIALFLYSLLPIIRNTHAGISGVDPAVREAARGMGMTERQLLFQVELPLSLGVIIAGVRVAAVISVGTATIAAVIGAGGLGTYIFRGVRSLNDTLILAGAIPAALLALAADSILGAIAGMFSPGKAGARGRAARIAVSTVAVVLGVSAVLWAVSGGISSTERIVVGSKDFTEQVILGELIAQTIEERTGLEVERAFELGGDACHRGLLSGRLDVYVEYSGTAFTTVLKHPPISEPREVFERVRREYRAEFDLEWLEPLGFQNTYAILIRGEVARELKIRTISDSATHTPAWRAGFGQDFVSREDGYPGLVRTYGLRFAGPPLEMDLALTYRALAAGQVDFIAGNSTDGLIDQLDLYQLEDDRKYFPPYEAAMVIRRDTLAGHAGLAEALNSLAGRLDDSIVRRMNHAVDAEKREPGQVVREFLRELNSAR